MEEQEKIWNAIAKPWANFRQKPIDEVVEFLKDKEGRVLDLGCGSGRNFTKINGVIYGVDFSDKMLEVAKESAKNKNVKVEFRKSSVLKLPFENNFFDAAIFVAVLQCVQIKEKRKESLKELFRVLKSKAEAYIGVWDLNQKGFESKEAFVPWKHNGKEYMRYYYLYDKKEFLNLIKSVGFEISGAWDIENPKGLYSKKNIIVVVRKP